MLVHMGWYWGWAFSVGTDWGGKGIEQKVLKGKKEKVLHRWPGASNPSAGGKVNLGLGHVFWVWEKRLSGALSWKLWELGYSIWV